MSNQKQRQLAISLYRNLLKRCKDFEPNHSLSHLNRRIDGVLITTSHDLRQTIRSSFRSPKVHEKEATQNALEALRTLYSLDVALLPIVNDDDPLSSEFSENKASLASSFPKDWFDAVEYLPRIEDTRDQPFRPSDLPIFPLSGALMPDFPSRQILPMFSQLTDVMVSGSEIPLRIFEPRYRQLYNDVLSDGRKQFVVPIPHPYDSGRFAKYGWLLEIVRVEDIADQTQGQIHLVAHHLVTRPVRIDAISNPTDWKTQSTYLRIQGEVLDDTFADGADLNQIAETLRELSSDKKYSTLAGKLLSGLAEGSIWSLVSVWLNWLQMEILELQVRITADIQRQAKQKGIETVDDNMIQSCQAPYREELESLLMEVSMLVPLLLQESPKDQCERMLNRIRSRLQKM